MFAGVIRQMHRIIGSGYQHAYNFYQNGGKSLVIKAIELAEQGTSADVKKPHR
jgi:hypothetical protein